MSICEGSRPLHIALPACGQLQDLPEALASNQQDVVIIPSKRPECTSSVLLFSIGDVLYDNTKVCPNQGLTDLERNAKLYR
jgi:hypothetical protein